MYDYFLKSLILTFLLIQISTFSQPKETSVGNIDFIGNNYFKDEQLAGFILTKSNNIFNSQQLYSDIQNIIRNYNIAGFSVVRVNNVTYNFNDDSTIVDISVFIEEGKRSTIGKIEITGNSGFDTETLLNLTSLNEGDIFDQKVLNQDIIEILNFYERNGYNFAQINIEDISEYSENGQNKILIKIRINENTRIKIDRVEIEGNTTTEDYVILRELRINKSGRTNKEELLDFRRRLENTGYFSSVSLPKIYKYEDRTVLKINVVEGNTNTFDGIIGYTPPAENEESGYVTGLINLSLRNLFGTGRNLEAKWDKQIKTTQELELRYLEPWVLNYPLNLHLNFIQRIQDSTYIKQNIGGRVEMFITDYFSASVLGQFERVIPSEDLQNSIPGLLVFNSRLLNAGLEIKFDTRDYIYNPTRGLLYKAGYKVGLKKIYNYAEFNDPDIKPEISVHNLTSGIDFYYSFFKRQSSLISLNGVNITAPKIETSDLFRLGGIKSVRGYRDEQFLASKAAWSNIEMRYALTRKTFAAVFYDAGYYFRPFDNFAGIQEQKEFIYGYGLSIRVETSLGIFGVSYALGKGDSPLEGKVHFGIINDF